MTRICDEEGIIRSVEAGHGHPDVADGITWPSARGRFRIHFDCCELPKACMYPWRSHRGVYSLSEPERHAYFILLLRQPMRCFSISCHSFPCFWTSLQYVRIFPNFVPFYFFFPCGMIVDIFWWDRYWLWSGDLFTIEYYGVWNLSRGDILYGWRRALLCVARCLPSIYLGVVPNLLFWVGKRGAFYRVPCWLWVGEALWVAWEWELMIWW